MGWKFWRRAPTAAEESLAALQQATPPVVTPPSSDSPPGSFEVGGRRVIVRRTERSNPMELPTDPEALQRLIGTSSVRFDLGDGYGFTMHVVSVVAGEGVLTLVGEMVHGQIAPGAEVGLVQTPVPHLDQDILERSEAERKQIMGELVSALLEAPRVRASVVSWDPGSLTLVISGATPDQASVGTLVMESRSNR